MTGGLVSCIVGERRYAIRGTDIREIVRAERIRPAGTRDGAIGTLVIAGEPIPVYALGATLDAGAAAENVTATAHHIVVTSGAQGPVGWLADRIVRSQSTDRLDVLPLPSVLAAGATGWFEGLLIVDGAPLLLLSPRNLDPRATPAPADADRFSHSCSGRPSGRPSDGLKPVAYMDVKNAIASSAVDGAPTTRSAEAGPALVVMFSSPALPPSGAARYALSARRIEAVVQSLDVTGVPGCPPHVTGVAVWRNHVMPVVDFRSSGERAVTADGTRFLIARCGRPLRGGWVAFAVSSELALHKPTREDREAEETEPTPPFVAGTFIVSGDRLALLDLDTLLLSGHSGLL